MKTYTVIGIVLIVIGIFAFAYQGFSFSTREKVVDICVEKTEDEVTMERKHRAEKLSVQEYRAITG